MGSSNAFHQLGQTLRGHLCISASVHHNLCVLLNMFLVSAFPTMSLATANTVMFSYTPVVIQMFVINSITFKNYTMGPTVGRVKFNKKTKIKNINISPLVFLKIFVLRKKRHPPFWNLRLGSYLNLAPKGVFKKIINVAITFYPCTLEKI